MLMKEINEDIFKWIEENKKDNVIVLMHCISNDCALGAGIAKAIDEKFQEKESIKRTFGENLLWFGHGYNLTTGHLNLEDVSPRFFVCNLVTKEFYWNKPTYTTLYEALESCKGLLQSTAQFAKRDGLGMKIVMPKIGCGLDKLNWNRVKEIILQWAGLTFDVTVCYL